jgi:PAS domain S-box-containing protein
MGEVPSNAAVLLLAEPADSHSLLRRQIKRHLGATDEITRPWARLLQAVDEAYRQGDQDRAMLERALEISSQELLHANSQTRAMLQAAPYLFLRVTIDGTVLEHKPGPLVELFCSNADVEDSGRPLVLRPDFLELFESAIAPLTLGEPVSSFDVEPSGGSGRLFEVRIVMLSLNQVVIVIRDITERRRAAEALQTSLEEFRTLAEAMPQIVWITGADGGNLYFNQHWVDYTGLTLEESLGHGWNKPFHPDDQQRAWHAWQHATATVGTYVLECRMRRADGEFRWWLIRGVPLRDTTGRVLKWFGTCTDIHDLKLAELEISRTNEALEAEIVERKRAEDAAETANRAKSQFLANMSHEIRTPLNGVVGMTELALGTDLSTEQREYLDIVKSSGTLLLTVIDDILDFSKIEAGKLTVDAIPFDLRDCLVTTLKLLATGAHLKGLELGCHIRPDVPAAVVGAPGRLRQIVTNLIGNAIKFTHHGDIALRVETETQTDGAATLRFSVSDTGIGISQEHKEAIFKPFVQADGSMTRRYGGTGLGLAISTNLVSLLGGRMWLESETGKGSTFHFTIPFGLQQTAVFETRATPSDGSDRLHAVPRHSLRGSGRPLRILVADDNKVNQLVAARLLEKSGHTVVVAENGREVLAAIEEHRSPGFDLILMDVQMHEMDGFEATGIIRAREKSTDIHLPIIAMTAHAMKGDEQRCLAAGMDAYVSKPFHVEEVFAAIDRVLMTRAAPFTRGDWDAVKG